MKRLEEMESMVRVDAGKEPVQRAPAPSTVAVPGGDLSVDAEIKVQLAELERAAMNVHHAFLTQLRAYRDVPPWPVPTGYRKRLAPSYLAQVYKHGATAA